MKLTPLDIRHKEFKRTMRGYADVEVDEFLDQVADEYERLFKDNIDLNERLEALQEKVAGYKRIEDTLQKTLVSAQGSAEELKQNASKEAQLILRDAELKGRQMVNDTYTEKQAIEQRMAKLRSAEQDFSFKFRQLLEGYLSQLEKTTHEKADASSEAAEKFDRQAQAIKDAIARETAAPAAEPAARPATQAPPAAPTPQAAPAAPAPAAAAAQPSQAPRPAAAPAPPAVDLSEVTLADARPAAANVAGTAREQAPLSKDDLLADVDGGVNENEFKW